MQLDAFVEPGECNLNVWGAPSYPYYSPRPQSGVSLLVRLLLPGRRRLHCVRERREDPPERQGRRGRDVRTEDDPRVSHLRLHVRGDPLRRDGHRDELEYQGAPRRPPHPRLLHRLHPHRRLS